MEVKHQKGRSLSKFLACFLAVSMVSTSLPLTVSASGGNSKKADGSAMEKAIAEVSHETRPGGLVGFEGEYELSDSDDMISVIVEFENQPAGLLRAMAETTGRSVPSTYALESRADQDKEDFYKVLDDAGIEYSVRYEYDTALNGISIDLPEYFVDDVAALDFVFSVYPNERYDNVTPPSIEGDGGARTFSADSEDFIEGMADSRAYLGIEELGLTGKGVTVGIIDTGIDYNHPDLKDAFSSKLPNGTSPAEGETLNGKFIGRNYINNGNADNNPMDDHGHGTHVAGTIGARGVNDTGISAKGLAPDATLVSYKAINSKNSCYLDDIVAAMTDAVKDGCRIISMSLGWGKENDATHGTNLALNSLALQNPDVLFVLAAGNDGPDSYTLGSPGTSALALTVANSRIPSLNRLLTLTTIPEEGQASQSEEIIPAFEIQPIVPEEAPAEPEAQPENPEAQPAPEKPEEEIIVPEQEKEESESEQEPEQESQLPEEEKKESSDEIVNNETKETEEKAEPAENEVPAEEAGTAAASEEVPPVSEEEKDEAQNVQPEADKEESKETEPKEPVPAEKEPAESEKEPAEPVVPQEENKDPEVPAEGSNAPDAQLPQDEDTQSPEVPEINKDAVSAVSSKSIQIRLIRSDWMDHVEEDPEGERYIIENSLTEDENGNYKMVVLPTTDGKGIGTGTQAEFDAFFADKTPVDYKGALFVVMRGESFDNTVARINAIAGKGAILVINGESGDLGNISWWQGYFKDYAPVFTTSYSDGMSIVSDMELGQEYAFRFTDAEGLHSTVDGDHGCYPSVDTSIGPVADSYELKPDIAAPGTSVISTVRKDYNGPSDSYENAYARMNGTSMATPHISAIAALLLEKNSSATALDLKSYLVNTANYDAFDTSISRTAVGSGMVDPAAALKAMEDGVTMTCKYTKVPAGDLESLYEINSPTLTIPAQERTGSKTVELKVEIKNNGSSIHSYCVDIINAAFTATDDGRNAQALSSNIFSSKVQNIAVAAGGTSTFTITASVNAEANPDGFYEATVLLTEDDGTTLSSPLGFRWYDKKIIPPITENPVNNYYTFLHSPVLSASENMQLKNFNVYGSDRVMFQTRFEDGTLQTWQPLLYDAEGNMLGIIDGYYSNKWEKWDWYHNDVITSNYTPATMDDNFNITVSGTRQAIPEGVYKLALKLTKEGAAPAVAIVSDLCIDNTLPDLRMSNIKENTWIGSKQGENVVFSGNVYDAMTENMKTKGINSAVDERIFGRTTSQKDNVVVLRINNHDYRAEIADNGDYTITVPVADAQGTAVVYYGDHFLPMGSEQRPATFKDGFDPAALSYTSTTNDRNKIPWMSFFAYRAANMTTKETAIGYEESVPGSDAQAPVISKHPVSADYNVGDTADALTVEASSPDNGTLSYQWYSNTSNSNTNGTLIADAVSASYVPATNAAGTTYYYCVVTNTNNSVSGKKEASVSSTAAKVVVTEAAPPIAENPVNAYYTFLHSPVVSASENMQLKNFSVYGSDRVMFQTRFEDGTIKIWQPLLYDAEGNMMGILDGYYQNDWEKWDWYHSNAITSNYTPATMDEDFNITLSGEKQAIPEGTYKMALKLSKEGAASKVVMVSDLCVDNTLPVLKTNNVKENTWLGKEQGENVVFSGNIYDAMTADMQKKGINSAVDERIFGRTTSQKDNVVVLRINNHDYRAEIANNGDYTITVPKADAEGTAVLYYGDHFLPMGSEQRPATFKDGFDPAALSYTSTTNDRSKIPWMSFFAYRAANMASKEIAVAVEAEIPVVDAKAPVISQQPKDASYRENEKADALTVKASSPDNGELSYQWYSNTADSNKGGKAIKGAEKANYVPETDEIGTVYYYCVVTNTNDAVNGSKTASAVSETAEITVKEKTPAHPEDSDKPSHKEDHKSNEENFWDEVEKEVKNAKAGETIKVYAGNYDNMPHSIMKLLDEKEVTLVIHWNNGNTITIPAGKAQADAKGRVYWPLSVLEELYGEEYVKPSSNKVNPNTGVPMGVQALIVIAVIFAVIYIVHKRSAKKENQNR